ncbi:hypothetical protein [Lentilitoribacter sp. Alg239-R112]|uniref:hypothetical protein n=1 Tax=Lentilitoribacter sp. Alg239-R112 TaxID=2305987 RepID=UPI0013A6F24C|nr:hypothetical protein [Lentilitoribacter sp. Alg239-R112]
MSDRTELLERLKSPCEIYVHWGAPPRDSPHKFYKYVGLTEWGEATDDDLLTIYFVSDLTDEWVMSHIKTQNSVVFLKGLIPNQPNMETKE